jgi:flagellar biosynthesis/type III secretory pathway M-ring protein FliF/YscJ
MSTGAIIAIVVVALVLLALVAFVLPRMRKNAQVRARERELGQRRERAAEEHRAEADSRRRDAEMAEQKARVAETEARRERAEAELGEERARMHERGMADQELIDENEREKFAGTSADDPTPMHEPAEGRFAREDETARSDEPSTTPRRD